MNGTAAFLAKQGGSVQGITSSQSKEDGMSNPSAAGPGCEAYFTRRLWEYPVRWGKCFRESWERTALGNQWRQLSSNLIHDALAEPDAHFSDMAKNSKRTQRTQLVFRKFKEARFQNFLCVSCACDLDFVRFLCMPPAFCAFLVLISVRFLCIASRVAR
jgi:hypothetical protein